MESEKNNSLTYLEKRKTELHVCNFGVGFLVHIGYYIVSTAAQKNV